MFFIGCDFGVFVLCFRFLGDFGDFGVSFVSTVAGRYTRWGGPLGVGFLIFNF